MIAFAAAFMLASLAAAPLAAEPANDLVAPPPSPETAAPAEPLPEARLIARATMVADKRVEIEAQWTSDQGPIYLDNITVYYLAGDGEIVREMTFDVRDIRAGFGFSRRFPLEPKADYIGLCAVYASAKDAQRTRASALFHNKGEGERSDLRSAPAPAFDNTQGCYTPER